MNTPKIPIGITLANSGSYASSAEVQRFLADNLEGAQVYAPHPERPVGKSAIDFYVLFHNTSAVASIGSFLWMAYDKFIGSKKRTSDDDAGLYVSLKRPDGSVADLWIGKHANTQEEVEQQLKLIVDTSRHDGDVVIEYERQIRELNSSGAWVPIRPRWFERIRTSLLLRKMTRRNKLRFLMILACCTGLALVVVSIRWKNSEFPSRWFTLEQPASETIASLEHTVGTGKRASVSYSTEVMIESDISPLEVKGILGKAKFLPHASTNNSGSIIGYVVTVSSDSLDREHLPEKYKTEKIISTKGGPLPSPPLDQATYEVYFVLRLLDKDGFELLSLNSPNHYLRSGETARIQGQTASAVSKSIASVTASITLHLVVEKCLSATSE